MLAPVLTSSQPHFALRNPGWLPVVMKARMDLEAAVRLDPGLAPHQDLAVSESMGLLALGDWPDGLTPRQAETLQRIRFLAMARSAHACPLCGAAGSYRRHARGHIVTACDEHAEGARPLVAPMTLRLGRAEYRYDPARDDLVPAADPCHNR